MQRSICAFAISLLIPYFGMALAFAQANPTSTVKEVPEYVIYDFYFRRIAFYEDLAQKKAQQGLNGEDMRAKIKKELGLTGDQYAFLLQTSARCLQETAAIDAQAEQIISREHARYPGGKLLSKDQVPLPPPELKGLQTSRNSLVFGAKARLLNYFGSATFQNIDAQIKTLIIPTIKTGHP